MAIDTINDPSIGTSNFFDFKISHPSNRSEFRESLRTLSHYAGKNLRQEDVERLLGNTPGFITTFNEIVRSVKDSSESGAFTELQAKKIIALVLDDAVSFITTPDNLERMLRQRARELVNVAVKEKSNCSKDQDKPKVLLRSEEKLIKDQIIRLTFGQHLSSHELERLTRTPHIDALIVSVEDKISTMSATLPREICEWAAAEAVATSVREATPDDAREERILKRFDENISYYLRTSSRSADKTKNETLPSDLRSLSSEFTHLFQTNVLDFIVEQSKLLSSAEQQSLLTTSKGILSSLKNDSSLTTKEKIQVACRAARATDKEIGFNTVSPEKFLGILVRNIACEKDLLLYPPKPLTQQEINEIRRHAGSQGYLAATATPPKVTIIHNTTVSKFEREKTLLAEAPRYRKIVEAMRTLGEMILADPTIFESNRAGLIKTLEEVSKIPQSIFSGNIQGMALGLSSHFKNGGGFYSVEKVQLRSIINGLSNAYDSENGKLRFEVITEKNHARSTAKNLLDRINKTLSDPERLSDRDGAIGSIRRANMVRDISFLLSYFDKDYNKSGISHSQEAAELRQLQSHLISGVQVGRSENLALLQRVQRFLNRVS